MELYVDGIPASPGHTRPPGPRAAPPSTRPVHRPRPATRYFNGKIADVEVWPGTALTPTQIADLSGTPGYVLFPSDSHQYISAASATTCQWVTARGEMNFYQGKITVKETGAGTSTVTFGPCGLPQWRPRPAEPTATSSSTRTAPTPR